MLDRTQESNAACLREEFDRLIREQDEAMSRAVYAGMSVTEARAYDQRHKRLTELFERLCISQLSDAPLQIQ
jgi:hypothetical protein